MIINVTLDILDPEFKIGDRVKLDKFFPGGSKWWNTPGTVTEVSLELGWMDTFKLSDPNYHFYLTNKHYINWIVHVLFDGAENPETVAAINLKLVLDI